MQHPTSRPLSIVPPPIIAPGAHRTPARVPIPRNAHAPVRRAEPELPVPVADVKQRAIDLMLRPAARILARLMSPLH